MSQTARRIPGGRGVRTLLRLVVALVSVAALWALCVWEMYVFGHRLHFRQAFGPRSGQPHTWLYLTPPIVAMAVGTPAAFFASGSRSWRRWSAVAALAVASGLPWTMVSGLAVEYWPPAQAAVVSGECPTPVVYRDGTYSLPDAAFTASDPGAVTAGGGLPAEFVPVMATRCLYRDVPDAEGGGVSVVVREKTATAGLATLVSALRRPSVVGGLTESCFDDRRTQHTGPFPEPPGYLVLTDAEGLSLLVGFPVDHCQTVHPDAVAAFEGLPWRLVDGWTVH